MPITYSTAEKGKKISKKKMQVYLVSATQIIIGRIDDAIATLLLNIL